MDEIKAIAPRRGLAFTLAKLFGWLTLIALYCGWICAEALLPVVKVFGVVVVTPAIFTTIVTYGRGWLRTFCVGALVPALLVAFSLSTLCLFATGIGGDITDVWPELRSAEFAVAVAGIYFASVGFVGLLAVCVRWLVE